MAKPVDLLFPTAVALLVLVTSVSCSDDGETLEDDSPYSAEADSGDSGDLGDTIGDAGPVADNGADATSDASPEADAGAGDTDSADASRSDTGDASQGDADPPPVADEVDPTCIDGQYTEALPDPSVDISAEINAYQSSNLHGFIDDILTKRYPVGAWVVQQALTNPQMDCVEVFTADTSSPGPVLGRLSVVVHECGHLQNFTFGGYNVTPATRFTCSGGGATFWRSKLLEDSFQQDRPPCASFPTGNCDHYASTYLEGNSGDQGFDMLLEEMHQYVNSLATGYAFHDYMSGSRSHMDGILTFM